MAKSEKPVGVQRRDHRAPAGRAPRPAAGGRGRATGTCATAASRSGCRCTPGLHGRLDRLERVVASVRVMPSTCVLRVPLMPAAALRSVLHRVLQRPVRGRGSGTSSVNAVAPDSARRSTSCSSTGVEAVRLATISVWCIPACTLPTRCVRVKGRRRLDQPVRPAITTAACSRVRASAACPVPACVTQRPLALSRLVQREEHRPRAPRCRRTTPSASARPPTRAARPASRALRP